MLGHKKVPASAGKGGVGTLFFVSYLFCKRASKNMVSSGSQVEVYCEMRVESWFWSFTT